MHLSVVAFLLFASTSWATDGFEAKIDPILRQKLQTTSRVDAIAYLNSSVDLAPFLLVREPKVRAQMIYDQLRQHANRTQMALQVFLKQNKIPFQSYFIENAVLLRQLTATQLQQLALRPEIEALRLDAKSKLKKVPADRRILEDDDGIASHLVRIGVDRVWSELKVKGQGIVLAGQDTGFFWNHNSLKKQYRGNQNGKVDHNYNWHDAMQGSLTPVDPDGHGTHTMGTMVGDGGQQHRIGVAPEAQWIGCRNMQADTGKLSTYLECFEFLLAPYPLGGTAARDGKPQMAPHIVNNSWTCPAEEGCRGDELIGSVRVMNAAGIFVVAAAGNHGPGCGSVNRSPAFYSGELLSVGAYNRYTKNIAYFSGWGPSKWNGGLSPDLVTPGEGIISAVPGGADKYEDMGGTSMASPQIAGVAALMWSAQPKLLGQVEITRRLMTQSADPLFTNENCPGYPGNKIPNAVFGYGMINAFKAVRLALDYKGE